jgi:tetratricopeptide (TPR) repeat protein
LSRAVEYFTEASTRDPQFALAYAGLADAMSLMSTGYYGNLPVADSIASALPPAKHAIAIAPDSAEAHASMGLIRYNQKDFDGAIASFEHAIRLRPSYSLAHVWLGLVLNSIGRYQEAAKRNLEALRLDPLSPIINTNAGIDAARFGRFDEAESRFRNAMELDPAFPVPYSGMARVKTMRGAIDESLQWIDQAIDRAPTRAYYLARKGFLYLQLEQFERAQEWLLAARTHASDSHFIGDAELGLAIAVDDRAELEKISNDDESRDHAQRALAAWVMGDEQAALAFYEQECPDHDLLIYELINDDWVWRFPHSLYRALLRARRNDAAGHGAALTFLESLEVVGKQSVVNSNAEYWAVVALLVLGREEPALDRLGKAIESGWRNAWWARRDPGLLSLAGNSRFNALLARTSKLILTDPDRPPRLDPDTRLRIR